MGIAWCACNSWSPTPWYNGLYCLKRMCDTDNTGQLLERFNTCREKDLDKFMENGLSMVDERKHGMTAVQRDAVVFFLETQASSLAVGRTRGVLLTKTAYIKHHLNMKHNMTTEKAKQMWNNDFNKPDVHTDVEDGETVMALRRPTTVDSEQARAKSRQMQQFFKVDGANFEN